jgi:GNAT superfamily N-acetyltransferase
MSQSVAIESVTRVNFREFVDLVASLAEYERLAPPDADACRRLEEDGLSDHPRYEAYLARAGTAAVGYVTFFFTYSTFLARPTLYLEDLFVRPEYRRKGIGRELFAFCRDRAWESGCGRFEWQVLDWNTPAIRFYEAQGAGRIGWSVYRIVRPDNLS